MKRTTLVLEEANMERLRAVAAKEGRTISGLVNEILLDGLERRSRGGARATIRLRAFSMGAPRVDLANRDAIEELIGS